MRLPSWDGVLACAVIGLMCGYLMHRLSSRMYYDAAASMIDTLRAKSPEEVDPNFVSKLSLSRQVRTTSLCLQRVR